MKRSVTIAGLIGVLVAASGGRAVAKGHVLSLDGDKIYVSLGASHGVGAGSKLTLHHVIEAVDPASQKRLRDTFAIGILTVVKAGDKLCLARAPAKLLHRVRPGDEVTLRSPKRVYIDPWAEHIRRQRDAVASPGASAGDARARARATQRIRAAELARDTWKQTLDKSPERAIAIWRGYVVAHPRSPYRDHVQREIGKLRALVQAQRQSVHERDGHERARLRTRRLAALVGDAATAQPLALRPPAYVYAGTPLSVAFTVLQPGKVGRAWLYFRKRGEQRYQKVELRKDGDHYLRARLGGRDVRAPGLELFVEALAPGASKPAEVWATELSPRRIEVARRIDRRPPERANRSRVRLFTDFVDFDGGFTDGFDQYWHLEADFMYRFFKPVYAMRIGFGTLRGQGGPKDVIDEDPTGCMDSSGRYRCRRVAFHYAYTELEFRISDVVAVMVRPQFGHGTSDSLPGTGPGRCDGLDINGCEIFSSFGLRARARIGDERATNLTLGVGVTENVGTLFEAAFTWDVVPKFPIVLSAQVTDQPVIENFGVRLISDIGWRAVDWFYPSLRLAFQARDVDHDGFSAGLAMNFDW